MGYYPGYFLPASRAAWGCAALNRTGASRGQSDLPKPTLTPLQRRHETWLRTVASALAPPPPHDPRLPDRRPGECAEGEEIAGDAPGDNLAGCLRSSLALLAGLVVIFLASLCRVPHR